MLVHLPHWLDGLWHRGMGYWDRAGGPGTAPGEALLVRGLR